MQLWKHLCLLLTVFESRDDINKVERGAWATSYTRVEKFEVMLWVRIAWYQKNYKALAFVQAINNRVKNFM